MQIFRILQLAKQRAIELRDEELKYIRTNPTHTNNAIEWVNIYNQEIKELTEQENTILGIGGDKDERK